jgi:DNA polymerase-3 subunit alpha
VASPDDVRKQADFEIDVITQMGFPGYFLVVADFINWAKDNGIRVGPGRGSGPARWSPTRCGSPTSTR